MKEYFQRKDTQISIGEMAELFEVSPRTLRLYHDMGLLIPQYINDSNGYRYYAQSQFPRLEKILQMKSLGLSLQQIKTMLEQKNLSLFEALLNERIDRLNEKIAQDTASRDILIKQLNSCAKLRNPPVLDSAFIEFIPKRYALDFQIDAYDLKEDYSNGSPWEQALGQIRGTLLNHHLSPSLLYQACCTITKQNLIEGRLNDPTRFEQIVVTVHVRWGHLMPESLALQGFLVFLFFGVISSEICKLGKIEVQNA